MKVRSVVLVGAGTAVIVAIALWAAVGPTYAAGTMLGWFAGAFVLVTLRLLASVLAGNTHNPKFGTTGVIVFALLKIPVILGTVYLSSQMEPGGTKGFLAGLASVYLPLILFGLLGARDEKP